ncbi:MAG: hypothetical protein K5790_05500 [Nitrosopumilus sp.]|uniref:hypothetical protein n=1 Tax=Nitrosopumilus sp. TaxID=2024843 RepID=UPI00247CFEB2|nr:hypothetical protein [Nitrosopumilus sp.]MCV0392735.1 hypothetical protein [Nitrosopumilus sp.]
MSLNPQNKKFKIYAIVLGLTGIVVTGAYFIPAQSTVISIPEKQVEDQYDALGYVQRFVVTSPTFVFDGDINTLHMDYLGSTKSIPSQHMFRATFDSSHGGFGNREGQFLIQVITPHTMEIIVSEGNVISAVTDETWDELNNQYVLKKPQLKLQSSQDSIIEFEGQVIDYQTLVSAIKSRGLLVKQVDEIIDSPFLVSTKVLSVSDIDLQVYEFGSASEVQKAIEMVSLDGTEIGLSIIRWMDVPHFYSQGKIIVQYIGHDPEMINLLDSLLGNQFAGM